MTADDLYGLPLGRFVAERAALARVLRGEKRREEAAAVAALRKPSVAAWAVNQLVRTQGQATEELFTAGDALGQAQAELLTGAGNARALRAARDRERAAVDRLLELAGGLLDAEGHELSPAVVDRVGETLHAAALDDGAREQVRKGRLERELRHVGLGGGGLEPAAAPSPAGRRGRPAAPPGPAAPAGERPSGREPPQGRGGPAREHRLLAATEPAEKTRRGASAKGDTRKSGRRGDEEATAEKAARRQREKAAAEESGRREREEVAAREAVRREAAATARAARLEEAAARRWAERAERAVDMADERRRRAADALGQAEQALIEARTRAEAAREEHGRAQAEADRAQRRAEEA